MGGAGYGEFGGEEPTPAYYGSIQLDFETPRFYTALMGRSISDGDVYPYQAIARSALHLRAEYNALQAWLIGQVSYFPAMNDAPNFTTMLRFLSYGVVGDRADLHGRPWLQLMVHY